MTNCFSYSSYESGAKKISTIRVCDPTPGKYLGLAQLTTRHVCLEDFRAVALLDDTERAPSPSVAEALHSYAMEPGRWSRRDEIRARLVA